MRLKRLELLGFKSFADRTVFDFGDHTMTGIVGPNGCGKSNVVDAIRWILGEQRPTSMRGKEMTDVIFKGSTSRTGMSFAEGCVVLDNSCGTIEGHGTEVSVTRRVFKSGEGEYLIDGQQVRLKDVREMLFDTGIGSRGYSVLEQGRIDAVLSSNPIDRRRIFEEAAGISRYRQRKHECELRLNRVQQDMERLEDVVRELEGRERSLKLQAGKARRYVEVRDSWRSKRTCHLEQSYQELSTDLGEVRGRMSEREEGLEEMRSSREEVERDVSLREKEEGALRSQLDQVSANASRLEGDGRELDERRRQLAVRAVELESSAERESQRAQELEDEIRRRREELVELGAERAELLTELAVSEAQAKEAREGSREATRRYREARTQAEEQNERVLGALHSRTEARNTIAHLRQASEGIVGRVERTSARLEEARQAERKGREELERTSVEFKEVSARLGAAEEATSRSEREFEDLEEAAASADRRRSKLEVEHATVVSRADALGDRAEELEGLQEGELITAVEAGSGPIQSQELAGLVADKLQTNTEHARALDAVLGERARALVVADVDSALRVAGWLREGERGTCALTLGAGFGAAADLDPSAASERLGAMGALIDQVRVDAGCEALMRALLGDVLLVESLEAGLGVLARESHWRCVTTAGELVDGHGILAGERRLTQGLAGRRARIEELCTEAEGLSAELAALEGDLENLRGRRVAIRTSMEEAAAEHELARAASADAQIAEKAASSRLGDAEEAVMHATREDEQVSAEATGLKERISSAEETLRQTEEAFEHENGSLQGMEDQRRSLEEARDERQRSEGGVEIERTRLAEASAGLERRGVDLDRLIADYAGELGRVRKQSDEHSGGAEASVAESESLAEASAKLLAERADADGRLEELRARNKTAREDLERLREGRDNAVHGMEVASLEIGEIRLEEQRHEMARVELLERALEELELNAGDLSQGFAPVEGLTGAPEAMKALEREVRELKRALDRIGPVNTEALDELEGVSDRLNFLKEQVSDLTRGRRMLLDTISKIETESERLFLETFNEVRENFQRIFRQMFGGGKADVRLAEGEEVMDAGVEIMARPPGREMLPIGLLSGGQRTMTALALLFSVFESRPSPFCVLDEVDAALDDANVQRFLAMLDTFRKTTQFVVVTHNKGTMAHAQRLYGVTMQTKGVSRQVEVDFSEVDDFVPDAAKAVPVKVLPRIEDPPEVPDIPKLKDYDEERAAQLEEGDSLEDEQGAEEPEGAVEAEPELSADLDAETGEPVVELTPPNLAVGLSAEELPDGASTETEGEGEAPLSVSPETLG
jgi:chromosome segregation protein